MADLSSDVEAVLDAMYEVNMDFGEENPALAAAAFLALEEQLAQDKPGPMSRDLEVAVLTERIRMLRKISAIAAELDATES
jgi:hypothetical protein